jgi:SWI/SNF-related matrix-associated actin-dependent regulator of chromatin subfamily A member 5
VKNRHREGWKVLAGGGYLHQFFDSATLDYLDEKEKLWKEYLQKLEDKKNKENGNNDEDEENNKENDDNKDNNDKNEEEEESSELVKPEEFTEEDEKYREELLKEGFKTWTKKDFSRFLQSAEIVGLDDPEQISRLMKTKTPEEVAKYINVFKKRIDEFPNGDRIMAKINKSENEKIKNNENQAVIDEYYNLLIEEEENDLCDVFNKINITYKETKSKKGNNNYNNDLFNEEEDKYLLCLLIKYGYRNWNPIKFHILTDPFMKFNINMKMKTDQELIDRANFIINLLKNEIKKIKEEKELIKKEKEKKQKNAMKAKLRKKNTKKKQEVEEEKEDNYEEDEEYEEEVKEKKKSKSKPKPKPNNKSKSKSKKKVNNKKKKKGKGRH